MLYLIYEELKNILSVYLNNDDLMINNDDLFPIFPFQK